MDVFEKELDVLHMYCENADLDLLSESCIMMEAGKIDEKMKATMENVKIKIKKIIDDLRWFYHELQLRVEEMMINKKLAKLTEDTTLQIRAETNDAILAYNAKKLITFQNEGIKKMHHQQVLYSSGRIQMDVALANIRKTGDETIAKLKSTAEEILSKSEDQSLKRKIKVRAARKKDVVQVMKKYQDSYKKITSKLESDCTNVLQTMCTFATKKKDPRPEELVFDQVIATIISMMNKEIAKAISKTFNALTKQIIVAAPSDTLEINLKKERDQVTAYGTAMGVAMSLKK